MIDGWGRILGCILLSWLLRARSRAEACAPGLPMPGHRGGVGVWHGRKRGVLSRHSERHRDLLPRDRLAGKKTMIPPGRRCPLWPFRRVLVHYSEDMLQHVAHDIASSHVVTDRGHHLLAKNLRGVPTPERSACPSDGESFIGRRSILPPLRLLRAPRGPGRVGGREHPLRGAISRLRSVISSERGSQGEAIAPLPNLT
jgi:hypothetical protein